MNKTWLKFLVGFSAILVAGCAAYFSVTGLGVLFAGASISVMVMAGSLEIAKLVAATYLKQEWDIIKGFNKWYLTISVGTLMLITSAGIFGYLSNAFQQQNLGLQKIERDIAVYQTQITKNESEITRYTNQLNNQQNIRNSQEANLSKQIDKDKSTSRVTQMIRTADREISSISKRIDELTKQNNVALDSINAIKNNNINLEREVGGFRFVAEAFNVPLNTVVKFFIFIIVIVFDPLAVALIIAFNGLLLGRRIENKVEETTEPVVQAKDIVAEVSRLRLSDDDLKKLEEVLLNPPSPNENLKKASEDYKNQIKEPFGEMLVKGETPTPIPTETPTPTPTVTETGTPTPTPTYIDKVDVVSRENNFFNIPAEGYTDELIIEDDNFPTIEPTVEEEEKNFSTLEPNEENIFQDDFTESETNEEISENVKQDEDYEGQFEDWENETVSEPFLTEEEITEVLNEVQTETFSDKPTTLNETSSIEDEKKNSIEFQQPTQDSEILEVLETEETSESTDYSTQSQVEDLYWERDEINPNQIIYDLENNKVIIPTSEEEIITSPTQTPTPLKVITRNVSPRRRKFR